MKKSIVLTIFSVVIGVSLAFLIVSIKGNNAEQQVINVVPEIKKWETKSAEWGQYYPRQYDSYMKTRQSDEIKEMLIRPWSLCGQVMVLPRITTRHAVTSTYWKTTSTPCAPVARLTTGPVRCQLLAGPVNHRMYRG